MSGFSTTFDAASLTTFSETLSKVSTPQVMTVVMGMSPNMLKNTNRSEQFLMHKFKLILQPSRI